MTAQAASTSRGGLWGAVARLLAAIGERRLIFLLVVSVLLGVLLSPMGAPAMTADNSSRDLYNAIEVLQPGQPVLVSFDFDPSSKPELYPASHAILRHAFRRKLRIITLGLWPAGIGMANEVITTEAALARERFALADPSETYPVDGKDYVFLGWQPGTFGVIVAMSEGIQSTFARDYSGRLTAELPIWTSGDRRTVRALGDLALVVTLSAGDPGIEQWIRYGRGKRAFPLGTAVTAVTAPEQMPFYKSGQIVGLLNGMRGAAEYEYLVNESEVQDLHGNAPPPLTEALSGMNALSALHFLIVALVVVSNVLYFTSRRRQRK
jgi:hypothetical protein